jgi:hypothetical protein
MGKALRTLIIEDSENDAVLLLRELRRGGYDVEYERAATADAMQTAHTHKTSDHLQSA